MLAQCPDDPSMGWRDVVGGRREIQANSRPQIPASVDGQSVV